MKQQIVIAGSGFAGMWAALSAARAVDLAGRSETVEITVVSPAPALHIRPRFYESALDEVAPQLSAVFEAVGVRHLAGWVVDVDSARRRIEVKQSSGQGLTLDYDRFILATGSQVFLPPVPGLAEFAFNVDSLESAQALEAHLGSLAIQPESRMRNTVVVVGGGFAGLETASEMPSRLRRIFGDCSRTRSIILERSAQIGPEMHPEARDMVDEALSICGVEAMTGACVTAVAPDGVTLADGRRIDAATVIWTGGLRANPLAAALGLGSDDLGRVTADGMLRAVGKSDIFVTGDVARAAADSAGNVAMMSCQHALSLGRVAGHNAAAELVGLPLHAYSQPKYSTCIDLGSWGALYTEGWDRQLRLSGAEGKAMKRQINTQWIYPPSPDRDLVFAIANPGYEVFA